MMKRFTVYQVDSFTRQKLHGNPAGVVPHADGLTEEQMQRIARELNNSETAFVLSSDSPEYDVEVRFFTPTTEVPLCGHATIAAHYVRALEGSAVSGCVLQRTKAGVLPVEIVREGDDYAIVMTQGKPHIDAPLNASIVRRIAAALGLTARDLREDCPVAVASAGHSKVMVGLRSEHLLNDLQPSMEALTSISREIGCNGYYAFTLSPEQPVLVHGRMFAPAVGIPEDPVTGNANGPLGAYLVHYGICRSLETEHELAFSILQGEAMGRDGGMRVRIDIENHEPSRVRIIGQAVVAFRTEMEL